MNTAAWPEVRNVIAVQNYGSSGSSFLQSLLDGHPQLIGAPHFFARDFFRFWRRLGVRDAKEVTEAFMQAHPQWFDPDLTDYTAGLHRLGEERNHTPHAPAGAFREHLASYLGDGAEITRKALFTGMHLAYAAAIGRLPAERRVDIVYPIHSEPDWAAAMLLEDFPETRFVHTVRDTRTLFPSYYRHLVHNHIGIKLDPLEATLRVIMDRDYAHLGAYELFGEIPYRPELVQSEQARAVRLEDLHRSPGSTLRQLARWLHIDWHEALLASTFDGQLWWNRPERPEATGFDHKRTEAGLPRLPVIDRLRLQWLTSEKLVAWGYTEREGIVRRAWRSLLGWLTLPLPWGAAFRHPPSDLRVLQMLLQVPIAMPGKAVERLKQALEREVAREAHLIWNEAISTVRRGRPAGTKARPAFAVAVLDPPHEPMVLDLYEQAMAPGAADRIAVKFVDELTEGERRRLPRIPMAIGRAVVRIGSYLAVRRLMVRAARRNRRERHCLVPLLESADASVPKAASA